MAFPFDFEENFEDGTIGGFASETDTSSILDIAHYSDIARYPGTGAPYRGAYAMRVVLNGGTTSAYLVESSATAMAAGETLYFRLKVFLSQDFTMANGDNFFIFGLYNAGASIEAVCGIRYTTAAGFQFGLGETSLTSYCDMQKGEWNDVEIAATIDSGVGDDGTLDLYLNGTLSISLTGLNQAEITTTRLGVQVPDAGTSGTILFDELVVDDARIYPDKTRFTQTKMVSADQHVFVGPGEIENVSLLSGNGTDCVVSIYDTDTADTNPSELKLELKNTAANELVDPAGTPVCVKRGAYITLSGTTPRAIVKFCPKVAYGSDDAIRGYGLRRIPPAPVS
jgi:hypothetical protein